MNTVNATTSNIAGAKKIIGADAVNKKGWFVAHRWLLLRRFVQFGILALFLGAPYRGWWIEGNLNYSETHLTAFFAQLDSSGNYIFDKTKAILPLTDPYLALQTLLAGHNLERLGWYGVAIVLIAYFLLGGRVFCSWVCPVNLLTDAAAWLRDRLGIKGSTHISRKSRYWILALTLIMAPLTGVIVWELVNPVSMFHRGLFFGIGMAWVVLLVVFLFDLFVMARGWCGHLCPVGAFYSLIGRWSPLKISAPARAACNDCMDCFAICPEPQVIRPALKGEDKGAGPVILSPACTNCGRCIDVCSESVFAFSSRFNQKATVRIAAAAPSSSTEI